LTARDLIRSLRDEHFDVEPLQKYAEPSQKQVPLAQEANAREKEERLRA